MKTIFLSIATALLTIGAYAQSDSTKRSGSHSDSKHYSNSNHHTDGFLYQNGHVSMITNGRSTRVDRDTTLSNGTVIMSNGNYMEKGGKKTMFKDGEHMSMSGKRTQDNMSSGMRDSKSQMHKDGYHFQNGRVMQLKNGKSTPIDKDVTLSNGTVISSNGSYTEKGKSRTKLREGDHMDMSGKIQGKDDKHMGRDKSDKNMYLVPDTAKNKRD